MLVGHYRQSGLVQGTHAPPASAPNPNAQYVQTVISNGHSKQFGSEHVWQLPSEVCIPYPGWHEEHAE